MIEFMVILGIYWIGSSIYKWYVGEQFSQIDHTNINVGKMTRDSINGVSKTQIMKNAVNGKYNK